jgi:hypothetical protein
MLIYRIRNKQLGLYSKGGAFPSWSKKGKIWKNIGHLKVHLKNVMARGSYRSFDNWIVESYEVKETQVSAIPAEHYFNEILRLRKEAEEELQKQKNFQEETKKKVLSRLSPEERKALGY